MARKRVILHCGAPKTATTSIQAACLASHDALLSDGILYPAVASDTAGVDTSRPFRTALFGDETDMPEGFSGHNFVFVGFRERRPPEGKFRQSLDEMDAQRRSVFQGFRDSDAHTLILSSENTFFRADSLNMGTLRDELGDVEVTVTMGLRHPADLLHSFYATFITGRSRSKMHASRYRTVEKYHEMGGYQSIISELRDRVRADRVIPFFMSDLFKSERSLLGTFLQIQGLDSRLEKDIYARPSPSAEAVMFLLRMNQAHLPNAAFFQVLGQFLQDGAPKGPLQTAGVKPSFFSTEVQTKLNARYQADLAWLKSEYGIEPRHETPFKPRRVLEENSLKTDMAFAEALAPGLDTKMGEQLLRFVRRAKTLPPLQDFDLKAERKIERREKSQTQRKADRQTKRKNTSLDERRAARKAKRQEDAKAKRGTAIDAEAVAKKRAERKAKRQEDAKAKRGTAADAEAIAKRQAERKAKRQEEAQAKRAAPVDAATLAKRRADRQARRKAEVVAARGAERRATRKDPNTAKTAANAPEPPLAQAQIPPTQGQSHD